MSIWQIKTLRIRFDDLYLSLPVMSKKCLLLRI